MAYQIWDTVQAFCSSITGVLAAQAMLIGVGVGNEKASVLAATITWLIKDGTGMVGRILFAWLKGINLDCDCKYWRFMADILNDIAIFLEILSPRFPDYFLFIVCVAGLLKSIVGVAGGATRASLTEHQAKRNNMADVSAKDGSQETIVNLVALVINLTFLPVIDGRPFFIWSLFVLFTCLHLYANYRAVSSVRLSTLNSGRMRLVAAAYFNRRHLMIESGDSALGVRAINRAEPILFDMSTHYPTTIGLSISRLRLERADTLNDLKDLFENERYLLHMNRPKGTIDILLEDGSTIKDHYKAFFNSVIIDHASQTIDTMNQEGDSLFYNLKHAISEGDDASILSESLLICDVHFKTFMSMLQYNRWRTDIALYGVGEYRYQLPKHEE